MQLSRVVAGVFSFRACIVRIQYEACNITKHRLICKLVEHAAFQYSKRSDISAANRTDNARKAIQAFAK